MWQPSQLTHAVIDDQSGVGVMTVVLLCLLSLAPSSLQVPSGLKIERTSAREAPSEARQQRKCASH